MTIEALEALSEYAERRRAEQINYTGGCFQEATYGADFLAWDIASLNLALLLDDLCPLPEEVAARVWG